MLKQKKWKEENLSNIPTKQNEKFIFAETEGMQQYLNYKNIPILCFFPRKQTIPQLSGQQDYNVDK